MENLIFKIDSIYYVLPPRAQTAVEGDQLCQPAVLYNAETSVTEIGQKFFENFITSYDYKNGKIDLGLNQNAFEGAATLTNMTEYVEPEIVPEEDIVEEPEEEIIEEPEEEIEEPQEETDQTDESA